MMIHSPLCHRLFPGCCPPRWPKDWQSFADCQSWFRLFFGQKLVDVLLSDEHTVDGDELGHFFALDNLDR